MDFIKKINSIYQKNQNIEIYLDMDGTIVEFLFDNENSFMKRGKYLKKRPIMPILNTIEIIKEKYPLIVFKILSCSSTNQMKEEKNAWIDKYIPYICRKNRIIFSKENGDYSDETISTIKATYLLKESSNSNILFLIDDNVKVLMEVQKLGKNNIIPIHVTSLLL